MNLLFAFMPFAITQAQQELIIGTFLGAIAMYVGIIAAWWRCGH